MSKYDTKFQETEAILAALQEDVDYLREVLADMMPGERRRLAEAADLLSGLADPQPVITRRGGNQG